MRLKICILLIVMLLTPSVSAEDSMGSITEEVSLNVAESASSPGGEWAVLGLARRGGWDGEEYIKNLSEYLKENNGVLSENKYTEYSRTVIALSALGKDSENIAGVDLIKPLLDYDKVTSQGINGSIFALLALDSYNPEEKESIKERYLSDILGSQLADGGFAMSGETAEADITAMAVSALAKYTGDEKVSVALNNAISCLSGMQAEDGTYESLGVSTAESTAQVLVALCEAGIDPEDERFVKNSHSVTDALLGFYQDGGFCHVKGGDVNEIATQQAFYALVAYERSLAGETTLFDMSDIKKEYSEFEEKEPLKKSFSDIADNKYKNEIEILAGMGVITGMSDNEFVPDENLTRAQFAVLAVNACGFEKQNETLFYDVPSDSWYAPYIGAAWGHGIISGVSDTEFAPEDYITKEQAAAMVARCAEALGETTQMSQEAIRDVLAQFPDYKECSDWALGALAYCYSNGILSTQDFEIDPQTFVRRDETAGMLYGLLSITGSI